MAPTQPQMQVRAELVLLRIQLAHLRPRLLQDPVRLVLQTRQTRESKRTQVMTKMRTRIERTSPANVAASVAQKGSSLDQERVEVAQQTSMVDHGDHGRDRHFVDHLVVPTFSLDREAKLSAGMQSYTGTTCRYLTLALNTNLTDHQDSLTGEAKHDCEEALKKGVKPPPGFSIPADSQRIAQLLDLLQHHSLLSAADALGDALPWPYYITAAFLAPLVTSGM
jgi:hypothetical protein